MDLIILTKSTFLQVAEWCYTSGSCTCTCELLIHKILLLFFLQGCWVSRCFLSSCFWHQQSSRYPSASTNHRKINKFSAYCSSVQCLNIFFLIFSRPNNSPYNNPSTFMTQSRIVSDVTARESARPPDVPRSNCKPQNMLMSQHDSVCSDSVKYYVLES